MQAINGDHEALKRRLSPLAQRDCVVRHVLHDAFRMRRIKLAGRVKLPIVFLRGAEQ